MHMLLAGGAVLHTLVVAVVAFFVLFAASKADGFVKFLGQLLGWILLIGALLGLVLGLYFAATGHPEPWMEHGHPGWMMRWHDEDTKSAAPTATPAQTAPAQPPAPPKSK